MAPMSSINHSIVHVTFDYPDEFAPEKTVAVKNLIQAQTAYHNIVVSLNRTANPFADFSPRKEPNGYSMMIFGLPFGVGLSLWMYLASKRIIRLLGHDWESVFLIHAHKL